MFQDDRGHSTFHMKDTSFEVLKLILDFVYLGEVKVGTEILADFMKTAESLQIRGLTQRTTYIKPELIHEDCEMDQSLNKTSEDVVPDDLINDIKEISNQEIKMESPEKIIKYESSSSGMFLYYSRI